MRTKEHGPNCDGCRELAFLTERDQARIRRDQLQRAVDAVRRLCEDGWAFENTGRRVVATEDVLHVLDHLVPVGGPNEVPV